MTASPNEAVAIMRAAMDTALSSPTGVRTSFPDALHGGRESGFRVAKAWRQRMYTARANMRRLQAKAEARSDVSIISNQGLAVEPDAYRTAYDTLFGDISRNEADDGWVLSICKADATTLGFESF